ncbi:MAG: oligoendopeptidase F, partial [Clostridia bacterium]|nr:oligoendopeptidase F [Clostridia bacterium]
MSDIKTAKKREEIDNQYKWALTDIYASDDDWEKDFAYLKEHGDDVLQFKGRLTKSSQDLAAALKLVDELSLKLEKLYVYAHMKKDEDNGQSKYQAMDDRAMNLSTELGSKLSFIDPEILSCDNETINKYIAENADLKDYDFFLAELMRQKEHVLDEKSEELLAMSHEMAGTAKTVFTMLNNVDLQFGTVKNEDGETVELTHGRYGDLMRSNDREVRKNTFFQFYNEFIAHKNTIASTYAGSVKAGMFYHKVRNYNSALEAGLFGDNVPVEVYNNLIDTIKGGLPTLGRYFELKRKYLGLDKMHMYDIYAPMETKEAKDKIPFSEAKGILLKGLSVLGEEYVSLLETAFSDKWMDVYENTGKTSGAYCWGVYGTHPFVLLNYQDNLDSVFTIAHELGHAMHSHFSDTSLPYSKAQYTIFVAEVASTVNEVLLNYHLLETTKDKEKKIAILHHFIEQFRTTLFRQTMFAEYEKITHGDCENGVPLTAEHLTKTYYDLNKQYHPSIECDEEIGYEWSRIPHFYNAFYVYKYATGFSAAVAIAN